jgi:dipeptidyl aminopeptidase/acylaminoacyl peptidase
MSRPARRAALQASILLAAAGLAAAPPAHSITVHDIFREPSLEGTRPQGEALSPDERWVAYAWNPDGRSAPLDLYVAPASGGSPRALTRFGADADTLRGRAAGQTPDSAVTRLPRYFEPPRRPGVGSIVWSPDSRRLAFVKGGDLYLVDAGGGGLQRLTRTPDAESEPCWSPDGRFLAFVRGGALWALQVDRTRLVQLTAAGGDSAAASAPQWSPDGRRIAYTTRDDRGLADLLVPNYLGDRVTTDSVKEGFPDQAVRVVETAALWDDDDSRAGLSDEPLRVVRMRLGPGKHPAVGAVAWSPDSRRLAILEILPDMRTRTLHVARADSGAVRSVATDVDSAWVDDYEWAIVDRPTLQWSPDGRWILFTTERSGFTHLARVGPDGGPVEPLTDGPWEAGWGAWMPDSRRVVVLGNRLRTSERRLEMLDTATRRLAPLDDEPGYSTHPILGARGGLVLYRHSRFAQPVDLWSVALRRGARPQPVTRSVPERFRAVDWVVPEIVEFPARDGVRLHGLVYRPQPFEPGKRYPVVVFVHGAGSMQNVVDGWTVYSPNFKFHTVLAQKGYVVFEVDYRGSLGYGRDFRTGVYLHLGGKDLDDELAGVDYLKTLDFVDASRIGIYGGSYGGFMTLMALFQSPQTYAAGAALRSVSDWANYYRGNPWYTTQRLRTPESQPQAYYRSSPIHFAEGLQDPLLLLHGVRDDNVHFQDVAQLTERLIRLGKKFEIMIYPRESHGFVGPESWIDEYRRIEAFFDRTLAAAPPGAGGVSGRSTTGPRQPR